MLGATPREFESRILRSRPGGRVIATVPARWLGYAGLAAVVVSVGLIVTTGLLGISAAVPRLPGGAGPPFAFRTSPLPESVTLLLAAAVLTGALGSGLLLLALHRGWAVPARRLLALGVLAVLCLVLVAPVGSADVKSYAAYGRMVALGLDPYDTRPIDLARQGDPIGLAVERPWRRTVSVYGPLATFEQYALVRVAGDSVRAAVALLVAVNALAFLGVGALLHRLARDAAGRRRAAVLWTLNPLLLLQLVSAAHVDTLVVLFAVGAVAAAARRPAVAGVLAAGAVAVKVSAVLVAAGVVWSLRRAPRRAGVAVLAAIGVLMPAYLAVGGTEAFTQVRRAARFVSYASAWRPVADLLDPVLGEVDSRDVIGWASMALAAAVALVLLWRIPDGSFPAAQPVAVLVLTWLFTAPYVLPWYDGLAWALLALLPATALDPALLVRTTVLSLAYLPGRVVPLPGGLVDVLTAVRADLAPVVLAALLLVLLVVPLRRQAVSGSSA